MIVLSASKYAGQVIIMYSIIGPTTEWVVECLLLGQITAAKLHIPFNIQLEFGLFMAAQKTMSINAMASKCNDIILW